MESQYSISVRWSDEDDAFIATCVEFPDLSAHGNTREEALRQAEDVLEAFIEIYREEGRPLPAPRILVDYSGQIRLRMEKSLHRRLAEEAEYNSTSLNSLIIGLLESGLERRISGNKRTRVNDDPIVKFMPTLVGYKMDWPRLAEGFIDFGDQKATKKATKCIKIEANGEN